MVENQDHQPVQQAGNASAAHVTHSLPAAMAAIPEALEGMQLSQSFSGSAQQLQADMDALRLSLETLDFGTLYLPSVHGCAEPLLQTALTQLYKSGGLTALPDAIHLTQQEGLPSGHEGHAMQTSEAMQLQPVNEPVKPSKELDSCADGQDDLSAFLSGECFHTICKGLRSQHDGELCLLSWCM